MSPISEDELENICLAEKKKNPQKPVKQTPWVFKLQGDKLCVQGRCKLCALNLL